MGAKRKKTMSPQRPQCPLCKGEGLIPHGVHVERFSGPPPSSFNPIQGINFTFEPQVHTRPEVAAELQKHGGTRTGSDRKYEKPPLGVMPRNLWISDRALELMRALAEQIGFGKAPSVQWVEELADIVNELAHS